MKKRLLSGGDDRGQILIMTALSMVAVLGVAALSLDASYMYEKRNRLHAAADGAAKSAAIEFARNESITQGQLEVFADREIATHGFTSTRASGTTTVVVNHPPTSGPYNGHFHYVEVIASEPTSMFFGGVLGWTSMTPRARAVAGVIPSPNCIITLAPPGSSPASMSLGNSTLTLANCNVADGGDLVGNNPNATINSPGTAVTGTCINRCGNIANLSEGATPPSDPLSGIGVPLNPGGCGTTPPKVGGVITVPSGCYSRLDIPNNTTVNFGPGLIYLTGAFTTGNSPTINGSGVVFYFAGTSATGACGGGASAGCISIGNGANVTLSAPVGGINNGILFFQAPTNQLNADFSGNGNPTYSLTGALYFPNADVAFRNSLELTTTNCLLFVGRSLTIENGNGSFVNNCSAFSGSPVRSVSLAE